MAPPRGEVLQGTLDLIVLKTIEALGPLHGYGIAQRLGRSAPSQPGHALSGTVAPGTAGMDLLQMGFIGEQPQSQVLRSDADRPKTIARRNRKLGTNDGAYDAPAGRRGRGVR